MELITGKINTPWMGLIYGVPGIGKSSLGAKAPSPLLIDLENGLSRIDCVRTPHITTWKAFEEALVYAASDKAKDFKTIVIDSVDALEAIITQKTLEEDGSGKKSLAEFSFGKGYDLLSSNWSLVLKMLDKLKIKFGKNILFIGHETIHNFQDPASDSYDRYTIHMHKKSASQLVSRCDFVFFSRYETHTKKREGAMVDKKRAIGTGRRLLHTQETPSWVAKNRFNLEPEIELSPEVFNLLA